MPSYALLLPWLVTSCASSAPVAAEDLAWFVAEGVPVGGLLQAVDGAHGVAARRRIELTGPSPAAARIDLWSVEPLTSASSWTWTGTAPTATLVTPQRVALSIDSVGAARTLTGGEPAFITLQTVSGQILTARLTVALGHGARLGSTQNTVSESFEPVFVRDAADPLRLRAEWHTTAQVDDLDVQTPDGPSPALFELDPFTWAVDWTFRQAAAALFPPGGLVRYTSVLFGGTVVDTTDYPTEVRVTSLALTDEDAGTTWPPTECTSDTLSCLQTTPQTTYDLASCGTFTEVAACVRDDVCLIEPTSPLTLVSTPPGPVQTAALTWESTCAQGGTWCSADAVSTWDVPVCLTPGSDLLALWDEVSAVEPALSSVPYVWGDALDTAGLPGVFFFGTSYASGGPDFLHALLAWGGDDEVIGWYGTSEVPCPNCTDFDDLLLLWFPATGRVLLLQGGHGYDS